MAMPSAKVVDFKGRLVDYGLLDGKRLAGLGCAHLAASLDADVDVEALIGGNSRFDGGFGGRC